MTAAPSLTQNTHSMSFSPCWPCLQDILTSLKVVLGTQTTRFSAARASSGQISVTGAVKGGEPYLVRIGSTDVQILMEGIVLLVRQVRPLLWASRRVFGVEGSSACRRFVAGCST